MLISNNNVNKDYYKLVSITKIKSIKNTFYKKIKESKDYLSDNRDNIYECIFIEDLEVYMETAFNNIYSEVSNICDELLEKED